MTIRDELRSESIRSEKLTRRRTNVDQMHIPAEIIPEGMSWEWKTESVAGQEDPRYQAGLQQNHWHPVDASRLPEQYRFNKSGAVRHGGSILMERPQYLTDEAREEDIAMARRMVTAGREKLANGQLSTGAPRTGHAKSDGYSAIPSAAMGDLPVED